MCASTRSTDWSSITAVSHDVPVIVKGLRAVSDFDYELQMAQMNRGLAGIDTLFIADESGVQLSLASSLVREVATNGGDVSGLVPDSVLARLGARLEGDS